ncbi:hypothetical protein [Mycolicibacter longobardus]|uniref:DUF4139 domain-containing protein n=1 Tax=Mycolicibacter longobardus TaxID=1108812 RepID=A0A1X1YKF0_9MYCO|nr:hypothetical protein [Mycolicibacter longobardus]MCV7383928.1 hypothetical protein [Mycolicibacter longobardus]ORW11534.1 hypothetical protein AWC16_10585 [Mycolicibacter longobardus]
MNARPHVDRLVLYKHGVAFVGRRGPVDGDFTLTFRRDDMKDVLKSLTVDAAGGSASVGAVSFDTPADPRTELADRNLLLNPGDALAGLFEALRGRAVEVHSGDQAHRGEVIGFDNVADAPARRLLVLRTDSGAVSLVDLTEAHRLDLLEGPSKDDLDYLIDRSRAATAGRNCDVAVQIRGASDDVRVSYIVAAPMWRVSYRAIRDGDTVTLVATGIIHNPIDEDLTDVEVTLTTGQPISFDIDLYHGRQVQRVVVEESERVAAPRRASSAEASMLGAVPMGNAGLAADAYRTAAADVETSDRGEYFEYRLATPVSLKRGGAAMVPLAVAPVDGVRRELVWREERGPVPDIVLGFTNTTGVVLEEGPAVIYEQGGYAGEAMLGFTSRGADVRLAFAKDLAVRCRSVASLQTVTTRIRLAADALVEEQRCERRHTLHAENDHDDSVDVIFELPVPPDHTVAAQAGVTDAGHDGVWCRFAVTVAGHRSAEATVLETWPVYREIAYDDLEPGRLEEWLADRTLDAQTVQALSQVLAHRNTARRLAEQCARAEEQRDEAYAAQSRIAEQLRVLGTDGAEGELRARQVRELEILQDRVGALDAEVRRLREQADAEQQRASDELRRVVGAEPA